MDNYKVSRSDEFGIAVESRYVIEACERAMNKFVSKVESGQAFSKETYGDLKDCLRKIQVLKGMY